MQVDSVGGPRWAAAMDVLKSGEASVGLAELVFASDPATEREGRRLHVEFLCRSDPLGAGGSARERLSAMGEHELVRARKVVQDACDADARFATLVEQSNVIFEYVYDYGMGTLLVATARPSGPLTWSGR
jgi:hypothetical protein